MTRFFILLLSLLLFSEKLDAFEKIVMEPGDARVIRVGKGSGLRLNAKNIVEVEALKDGEYRILAMRSGLVHIRAKGEGDQPSWFVEVQRRDPENLWLAKERWHGFFCGKPGVNCDPENALIAGQTDDLAWLHQARNACLKKAGCRFLVTLTPRGREAWKERMLAYAPEQRIEVDGDGLVTLLRDCAHEKDFEAFRKAMDETFGIAVQAVCQKAKMESWALDVLAIAKRRHTSDLSNPIRWKILQLPMHDDLTAIVEGISSDSGLRILAQPTLLLSPGASILLADGMEIQTLAAQKDSAEVLWKPVGFRLEMKFLEEKADAAHFQVALNLSRAQGGLRTVDASQLQSELWLPIERFTLVGTIQATMDSDEERRIPWLSAIPFLGELFTWKEEGQGKSEVELYLRLRKGDLSAPGAEQKDDSLETE